MNSKRKPGCCPNSTKTVVLFLSQFIIILIALSVELLFAPFYSPSLVSLSVTTMTAKSPPSEEDMQKLTDAVESILAAVDDRQQARMANTGASWTVLGGPLTVQELNSLRLMPSLGDNADLLQTLCSMLETHVDSASSVNLIEEVHQLLSKSKKLDYDGIKTKTTTNKSQLVEEVCLCVDPVLVGRDVSCHSLKSHFYFLLPSAYRVNLTR
jgi:hypothetical protein